MLNPKMWVQNWLRGSDIMRNMTTPIISCESIIQNCPYLDINNPSLSIDLDTVYDFSQKYSRDDFTVGNCYDLYVCITFDDAVLVLDTLLNNRKALVTVWTEKNRWIVVADSE